MKRCGWVAVGYSVKTEGRGIKITLHAGSTSIAHAERRVGCDVAAAFIAWYSGPPAPSFEFSSFLVDTTWHNALTGGDLRFTLPYLNEEHRVCLQGELARGFVAAIREALAET